MKILFSIAFFVFKSGVPRTAYMGVLKVHYDGKEIFIMPQQPWQGYDLSWT
jgi:hypothetical protein